MPVVVAPHQEVVVPILLHVLRCVCSTEPVYSSGVVVICSTIPIPSVSKQSLNLVLLGVHSWATSYDIPFPVCHYVYKSYQCVCLTGLILLLVLFCSRTRHQQFTFYPPFAPVTRSTVCHVHIKKLQQPFLSVPIVSGWHFPVLWVWV